MNKSRTYLQNITNKLDILLGDLVDEVLSQEEVLVRKQFLK